MHTSAVEDTSIVTSGQDVVAVELHVAEPYLASRSVASLPRWKRGSMRGSRRMVGRSSFSGFCLSLAGAAASSACASIAMLASRHALPFIGTAIVL